MNAHPILLQIKYARVVALFAEEAGLTLSDALDFFYHSRTYYLVSNGISDMHCMSDGYLSEDLQEELAAARSAQTGAASAAGPEAAAANGEYEDESIR